MKNLFHGSIDEFETIDINKGKGYKDFGKGFYATAVASHAEKITIRNKQIALRRRKYLKGNVKLFPIVAYRYNLIFSENYEGLSVKIFDNADAEWLRFIIANRKCNGSVHDYDIVIGPTADAETTTIINDYIDELEESGYSDEVCNKVIAELKPENLPKQYFFRTEKAIRTLSFDKIKRQVIG